MKSPSTCFYHLRLPTCLRVIRSTELQIIQACLINSLHKLLIKIWSLSETIDTGNPCNLTTSLRKSAATFTAEKGDQGVKNGHILSVYPLPPGEYLFLLHWVIQIRSITISVQNCLGMGSD